jgi:hypothetical protein
MVLKGISGINRKYGVNASLLHLLCFNQRFAVSAIEAYKWSTDYRSDDYSLMGLKGKRRIKKISDDTIILTDTVTVNGEVVEKKRLVRLNSLKLSWTNTHLSGPNRYSQFLYGIVAEGEENSRLDFTGLLVIYGKNKPTPEQIALVAREEREQDARIWKLLAKAMEKEIRQLGSSTS